MNASLPIDIAEAILWFHVVVIAFNVFGLVAIPLGAWSGWKFVRVFWWRALHLGLLGIVALQAVLGQACFLTIWESDFLRRAGGAASNEPLIRRGVSPPHAHCLGDRLGPLAPSVSAIVDRLSGQRFPRYRH
jgi:hypothetical protein